MKTESQIDRSRSPFVLCSREGSRARARLSVVLREQESDSSAALQLCIRAECQRDGIHFHLLRMNETDKSLQSVCISEALLHHHTCQISTLSERLVPSLLLIAYKHKDHIGLAPKADVSRRCDLVERLRKAVVAPWKHRTVQSVIAEQSS